MSKRIALGLAIRSIREAKKESRPEFAGSQFATRVLISHAYLVNIEKGRKQPTPELLARIAIALAVDLDAISYVPEGQALAS